jgi:hypothetical protein
LFLASRRPISRPLPRSGSDPTTVEVRARPPGGSVKSTHFDKVARTPLRSVDGPLS